MVRSGHWWQLNEAQNPEGPNTNAQPKPLDEMASIDETAKLLNVSTTLLRRWALADFGPTLYIVDNSFRYRRDEVIEWRDKNWKRDRFTQAG